MVQIIWTEPALEDLKGIAEYIALSNPDAAASLVQSVFDKIGRLEEFPESGKVPAELEGFNYREVVVEPLRIFYKLDANSVFVLHVLREERDLRNFLLGQRLN
ncbi:MAG: type II toxin-antitoxin system RelE/ParE family toxin [Cellvibrionaceae bacterium]